MVRVPRDPLLLVAGSDFARNALCFVRWESHNGKYSGQWKPWVDERGRQYVGSDDNTGSLLKRGAIVLKGVQFTQKEVHRGGGYYKDEGQARCRRCGKVCRVQIDAKRRG